MSKIEIFDCTHPVDCLFCKRKHECEDPKNQATLHESVKDVDEAIKRIEDHPDAQARVRLTEEGQKIKEAIAEFGASPTSYLFVVGKK